eukprot:TRINITY_DN4167_c1_g1_i1.p1 TRINITY_DN4167_c1_g1~~TRINITY_DN4167_c1_g1_i1.p1  ORF type:complete len:195 (+),score=7.49 TRINITY_DN4167_c1_g1_i1:57-587(+)
MANRLKISERFAKEYPQMKPNNPSDSTSSTIAQCRSIPFDLLQKRRARFVSGFWQKSLLSAVDLAKLKRKYILAGYDWPSMPSKTLSKFYENSRTTYYHPDKITRMKNVQNCMKKMPELLKLYKQKVKWEKKQFESKSFKSEQEIYLEALISLPKEPRNWLEENLRHKKSRKFRPS